MLTIPIGLLLLAIIRLVMEYLFIRTMADEINKSLLATIGLLFIILTALVFILIFEIDLRKSPSVIIPFIFLFFLSHD